MPYPLCTIHFPLLNGSQEKPTRGPQFHSRFFTKRRGSYPRLEPHTIGNGRLPLASVSRDTTALLNSSTGSLPSEHATTIPPPLDTSGLNMARRLPSSS